MKRRLPMFFSWVRRSALKTQNNTASLLLKQGPGQPQMVVITGMAALFIGVGTVMYTRVGADQATNLSVVVPLRVLEVDGVPFPPDGVFDLNYLPNGRHKVVYGSDPAGVSIDVNNDAGPLVAARNWAFGWLHGNKLAVDRAVWGVTIAAGLLLLMMGIQRWLRYRIRSNVK